jgi:hypothetical protein
MSKMKRFVNNRMGQMKGIFSPSKYFFYLIINTEKLGRDIILGFFGSCLHNTLLRSVILNNNELYAENSIDVSAIIH